MKAIAQGAEATLYLDGATVVKQRIPKSYRHPLLDEKLRAQRTRKEAKILKSLPILGPKLLESDGKERIVMSFVDGKPLREILDDNVALAEEVGKNLRKMHDKNIIHGDLTTSNMILSDGKVAFIDFGLSFTSTRTEDRAVDIHLFKEALESTHYRIVEEAMKLFWKGYGSDKAVKERFKTVESRGRNKEKY
ncbi:MAG: KEOPS complex kinase/ATPase Bud32 [Candidatus Woesearchaeota archaeon]